MSANAKFTPELLLPQGWHWHWDGPTVFNFEMFDMVGNLRRDVKGCRHQARGPWYSLFHNKLSAFLPAQDNVLLGSFSALFAMLSGTYIETPCDKRSLNALKVKADLRRAMLLTFFWKHRGKGDNPYHQVRPSYPVPIHERIHFYVFYLDQRMFPTVDIEALLEFLSLCATTVLTTAPVFPRMQPLLKHLA